MPDPTRLLLEPREGYPVSFAAVAIRAEVSRPFLYRHPEFRAEIEALRSTYTLAPSRLPVRERGSDASVRSRLQAALQENQRLRDENSALREELAIAHGRARELELDRRARA
jgi:hypothetical protein